jgi:hypothetical protein
MSVHSSRGDRFIDRRTRPERPRRRPPNHDPDAGIYGRNPRHFRQSIVGVVL